MSRKKVIIMGAAGRDFHNFNTYYRDNERYEVVAFTATQIPDIHGRKYPPELAGSLYPEGIPIYDQRAVSYTHLDVYKRQLPGRGTLTLTWLGQSNVMECADEQLFSMDFKLD